MSVQAAIVMVGAVGLMVSSVVLVRRRLLSIRYGLGWLTVAAVGIVGAPLLGLVSSQIDRLGFTETGFSLGLFIAFLGLVCLQLSISLSGLHHAVRDLAEYSALAEQRLTELERERSERGGANAEAETDAAAGVERLS